MLSAVQSRLLPLQPVRTLMRFDKLSVSLGEELLSAQAQHVVQGCHLPTGSGRNSSSSGCALPCNHVNAGTA